MRFSQNYTPQAAIPHQSPFGDSFPYVDAVEVIGKKVPVISSVAIAAAAGDTLVVAEPGADTVLTGVNVTGTPKYGEIKGEDMTLTTVYIKVANPVNGVAPALTVGTDTYKATYAGIKDYNGYYVYQILAKDAIDLTKTAYTVTYDGAADYSFTPAE